MCTWRRVGTFTLVEREGELVQRVGGNAAIYLCTPAGEVLDMVLGASSPDELLRQVHWTRTLWRGLRDRTSPVAAEERRVVVALAHRAACHEAARAPGRGTYLGLLREVIHARLASTPLVPLQEVMRTVWTDWLGQPFSDTGPTTMTFEEAMQKGLIGAG